MRKLLYLSYFIYLFFNAVTVVFAEQLEPVNQVAEPKATQTRTAIPLADSFDLLQKSSNRYYLSLGLDNQLLMRVNVWGEVRQPGVKEVPDQTDLLTLISIAGGPTDGAKLSKVKIVRNNPFSKQITVVNLERYLNSGAEPPDDRLLPGDTVIIPKTKFTSATKYLAFLSSLAMIATAVKVYTQ